MREQIRAEARFWINGRDRRRIVEGERKARKRSDGARALIFARIQSTFLSVALIELWATRMLRRGEAKEARQLPACPRRCVAAPVGAVKQQLSFGPRETRSPRKPRVYVYRRLKPTARVACTPRRTEREACIRNGGSRKKDFVRANSPEPGEKWEGIDVIISG